MFRLNGTEVEVLNRSQLATGSQKHRDPAIPAFRLHRARRHHGCHDLEQLPCRRDEPLRRARVREAARAARLEAIRALMDTPAPKRRSIGFTGDLEEK
jgi:hypothetical protein